LSDVLPFHLRQVVKPIIEILASIPSVAYGFFALVVMAPLMQEQGGRLLAWATWLAGIPIGVLAVLLLAEVVVRPLSEPARRVARIPALLALGAGAALGVRALANAAAALDVPSGANALNVSLILAVMVLPTVVSVSEDALQAVGRELREASYACGATRAETLMLVVLPAASSGICAAVILGLMRAVGETMVVWMASGNAAQIPKPWYNLLQPVRTLTATIAGDMGEADHVTGSARYHVLFAMALLLLSLSFLCNLTSEWVMRRERKKLKGA
jgi:phosphate transport system permease protein